MSSGPVGEGQRTEAPSPTGHIVCCICLLPISLDEYRSARCWTDPEGVTVAAHAACLIWIGENELHLPPDPGESTVNYGATP